MLNTTVAFLNFCRKPPNEWIGHVPPFTRDNKARNPNTRQRRRIGELSSELVFMLIEHASPHLKGQIAAYWTTGARSSSILFDCRVCDIILAPGRSQITFHDTKNGEDVTAAIHPAVEPVFHDYLKWRGRLEDREAPLFLTYFRHPYTENGKQWGSYNRKAFITAKTRTAKTLRKAGRDADAALIEKVTPHWFRHMLATNMLRVSGGDMKSVMAQGGWLDPRSVMGYAHDAPDHRRDVVNRLPIGGAENAGAAGEGRGYP